jgi:hypothetical protein
MKALFSVLVFKKDTLDGDCNYGIKKAISQIQQRTKSAMISGGIC